MNVNLFVMTPTKLRDFEIVVSLNDVGDNQVIINKIRSPYLSIDNQIKEKFMYLIVNLNKYVLAGAWLDIASLVEENRIEGTYGVRKRNAYKNESYYSFVGFFFEKTKTVKRYKVSNQDFISAFNGVIKTIWDREDSQTYDIQKALFDIDESNDKPNELLLNLIKKNEKCFIKDIAPTIDVFNIVLNSMLSDNYNLYTAFCSNYRNKKEFLMQKEFMLGCGYKKNKLSTGYMDKYPIFYDNDFDLRVSRSIFTSANKSNDTLTGGGVSCSADTFDNVDNDSLHDEFSSENPDNCEMNASVNDSSNIYVVQRGKIIKKEDIIEKTSYKESNIENKNNNINDKNSNMNVENQFNNIDNNNINRMGCRKKLNKKKFFKKFIKFITTDIRDLKGRMNENED